MPSLRTRTVIQSLVTALAIIFFSLAYIGPSPDQGLHLMHTLVYAVPTSIIIWLIVSHYYGQIHLRPWLHDGSYLVMGTLCYTYLIKYSYRPILGLFLGMFLITAFMHLADNNIRFVAANNLHKTLKGVSVRDSSFFRRAIRTWLQNNPRPLTTSSRFDLAIGLLIIQSISGNSRITDALGKRGKSLGSLEDTIRASAQHTVALTESWLGQHRTGSNRPTHSETFVLISNAVTNRRIYDDIPDQIRTAVQAITDHTVTQMKLGLTTYITMGEDIDIMIYTLLTSVFLFTQAYIKCELPDLDDPS